MIIIITISFVTLIISTYKVLGHLIIRKVRTSGAPRQGGSRKVAPAVHFQKTMDSGALRVVSRLSRVCDGMGWNGMRGDGMRWDAMGCDGMCRQWLNGYLAGWVPSPPGKHNFKNFTVKTNPKTDCKNDTRYPLG